MRDKPKTFRILPVHEIDTDWTAPAPLARRAEGSMSKHTAGPWYVAQTSPGFEIMETEGCRILAKIPWESSMDRANADLIAAAPELLTALATLLECAHPLGRACACRLAAEEAIAKAKGAV